MSLFSVRANLASVLLLRKKKQSGTNNTWKFFLYRDVVVETLNKKLLYVTDII